jgi:hypothetical protein
MLIPVPASCFVTLMQVSGLVISACSLVIPAFHSQAPPCYYGIGVTASSDEPNSFILLVTNQSDPIFLVSLPRSEHVLSTVWYCSPCTVTIVCSGLWEGGHLRVSILLKAPPLWLLCGWLMLSVHPIGAICARGIPLGEASRLCSYPNLTLRIVSWGCCRASNLRCSV